MYIIHVFVFGDSSPNSCVQEKVKKAFPLLQIETDTVVFKWQHCTRKRKVSEGLSLWQAAECLSRYSTAVEELNDEMIGANRPDRCGLRLPVACHRNVSYTYTHACIYIYVCGVAVQVLTHVQYLSRWRQKLRDMCKAAGLKQMGTNDELQSRLITNSIESIDKDRQNTRP